MKIEMLEDYSYNIPNGISKLHKGENYKSDGWHDGMYLVRVTDRKEHVRVPERVVRIEHLKPAGDSASIRLQHFSRPDSEHYHTGGIDVWKFAEVNFDYDEVFGFHRIDAIKYLTRFGKKQGRNIRDLEKARAEIDEMIRMEKERNANG